MKEKTNVRELFAATQEEMAMLLGVGVGHYSMYESGKRSLPLKAQQVLAEMLTHVSAQKELVKKPTQEALREQQDKRQQQLQRLLQENHYQRLLTVRKIAAAAKKLEAGINRKLLVDYLGSAAGKTVFKEKAGSISATAVKTQRRDMGDALLAMEVRSEVLELEKVVLERMLGELGFG